MNKIDQSLFKLLRYIKQKDFRGYDPYDTLNSWFPFHKFGKWGPIIAIQLQKKNPINIRSLLGIKNDYNPKAMGLFLNCYSILYEKFNQNEYLEYAEFFLNWLKKKYSKGYSGYCWGYNFPYATVYRYQKPFIPSSVVTGIVSKGIFSYYKITKNEVAKNMLIGAADFVLNDLNQSNLNNGICFSYTPIQTDLCFNASLLAAEILSIVYTIDPRTELMDKAIQAVNWVINHHTLVQKRV